MGGEGGGGFEGVAILVVEAALTGTKDDSSDKGGGSSSHVHDTGSGKVNISYTTEGVVTEGGQETVGTPDGTDNDRVDETSKEDGVAEVGRHLTTFGNCTGDDGGSSGGEGELEEPSDEVTSRLEVTAEETGSSNEVLFSGGVGVIGEGVTDGPESEGTTTSIEEILKHDILDILLTDGTSTKHGETRLHQENGGTL